MATFTWQTAAPANLEAASFFTGITGDNLTETPVSNAVFYRSDGTRILLSGTGLSKVLVGPPESGTWQIAGTVTAIAVATPPFDSTSYWLTISTLEPLAIFFELGAGPANPAYNAHVLETIFSGNDLIGDRDNSANILHGFGGDDTLVGRLDGADTLDGGAGTDTADYSSPAGRLYVSLLHRQAIFLDAYDLQKDTLINIENVIGGDWSDFLEGDDQDNVLKGSAGSDFLVGHAGSDAASYAGDYGGVFVSLASGTGLWNAAEGDVLIGIENLIGTVYNDVLVGNAGDNRLEGGIGDDYLYGLGGTNTFIGGPGSDWLYGDSGNDTADYSEAYGAIWIDLDSGVGRWNHAEGDTLASIDHVTGTAWRDHLIGDRGDNRLDGGDGDDVLVGSGGDDVLFGGLGQDRLDGGLGQDRLDGGIGMDTADYANAYGAVWVDLTTGVGRWNYAEGDSLSGIENLVGTAWGDRLAGNAANNILTGGAGADVFLMGAGFGQDVITDFDGGGASAGDVIGFVAGLFTDFADLMGHAVQQGSDVVITSGTNTLSLIGIQRSALHANDFDFSAASSAADADAFIILANMPLPRPLPPSHGLLDMPVLVPAEAWDHGATIVQTGGGPIPDQDPCLDRHHLDWF